jgi:hypothetical protein
MNSREIKKRTNGTYSTQSLQSLQDRINKTKTCWIWTGAKSSDGYGKVGYNYKTYRVHRLVYELITGNSIKGLYLCHKCDNPLCVRPDHMFLGTQKDNVLDREKKGRGIKGETHPHAKLKEKEVLKIRELLKNGTKIKTLAAYYKVHKSTIDGIKYKRIWKWL